MKRYILTLAGVAFLVGSPLLADDMKMDKDMKHDMSGAMCEKHCNLMDLQKEIKNLEGQAASADKVTTKDHLMNDVKTYKKKLAEMEKELKEMK